MERVLSMRSKFLLTSALAVLLLNAWGDIESTNNIGYTTGADGTQQLVNVVYYNSFDSAEQVAHPAFGPTSICWNVELRDGKKGQALYVPANTPTIGIPFTQGLPQEKGCIEFWAKILPSGASFYDSGNPRFFMFNPKNKPDKMESAFSWLELNGNNGCGQSGWIFAFFSVFKTSHTWGSGSSYPEVFGDLDYRDWHHYVIKWNVDGLSDDATTAIRFSVDNETKIAFSTSEVDPNLLKSYLSKSFEMYWPRPDGDPVSFQKSNVPFLLDELTIWDSDVTESVPPSPSQPAAGSLVYYSTLDSATAVTQPEVGAAGICESSATFGTGKSGQALYVPAGVTVAKIPFPHGLPIEKGLIEFWAKIDTANPTYSSGGNPLFFSFNRTKPDINGNLGTSVTFFEINSNNGWGGSGFSFVLGDIFSSPCVSGWSNAYASLFGESGDQTWHHYELKWNIAGLAEDSQSVCLLKVDGAVKTKTALEKLNVESFKEAMDYPCELIFSYRPNDYSRVPFWIDEFKIWNSDVGNAGPSTEPTDPVAPGTTEDLWYYTTFDSAAAVTTPEVGGKGSCSSAQFQAGLKGQALYVPANASSGVNVKFDKGLPVEQGRITYSAKILATSMNYRDGSNPRFFNILPQERVGEYPWIVTLDITANNGADSSGWDMVLGGPLVTSIPYSSGVQNYSEVFGEADPLAWHDYELRWNLKGLDAAGNVIAFYLDGKFVMGCTKEAVDETYFRTSMAKPLELYFPSAPNRYGQFNSRVPFLIDEFKVWGTTGTSDSPVVDPVDPKDPTDPMNPVVPMDPTEPVDPSTTNGLMYYTTFDSAFAVMMPEVGSAGACSSAQFQTGLKGQALYVPANASSGVNVKFDKGLPVEQGRITYSAKILATSMSYGGGSNPRFFNILPQERVGDYPWIVTLDITANNGADSSGWDMVLGGPLVTSIPYSSGVQNYSEVFGDADPLAWHDYELRWNLKGLDASGNVIAFYLDGKFVMGCTKEAVDETYFRTSMAKPLELYFPSAPDRSGRINSRVPYLIDEFKVWGTSEPVPADDPADEPTDDPVAEGLVLSNIAKSYPAGLEIEPIAVTYTGAAEKAKVSVSGLPQGLVFKNGVIAGTPELPGEATVVVTVKSGSATVTTRTVTIRVSNYVDDLVSGLADAYGPFVPGEPLDLDLAPVAGWKAAHVLPSGLSFSATTGRLTGTPKKPGVYPLVFTRKVGFALRAVSTLVTIAPLRQVKVEAEGEGTVKGAGTYLAHARVTLTAKAAKGYAVLGWYRGEERVSRDASFAYTVGPEAEQTLVAKFVTQEADRASIGVAFGETALDPVETLVVTNYQGVAVSWPLACDALTKPTVSVSGLPSGLSFKNGLLKGASTTVSTLNKAGTYKPKTAKVTVKTLGGTTAKYAIDFVTLPRPAWAAGSYDGVYSLEGEVVGRVTLTLNPNGKASGKVWTTVDGAAVTATLTAPMITAYDADSDTFRIEATCAVKKQSDQTIVFTLSAREADGVGTLEAAGEGDAFTLVQNIWTEKSFDAPAFPSGKKALSLTLPEGLTLKFGAKGVVTCAGKLDGENGAKVSVSGIAQLVLDAEGQGAVLIYLAPKKNFGGFIQCVPLACEVVDGEVTQVGLR